MSATHVSDIECSVCGLDGGPSPSCDLCHGNQKFVQSRAFTLTEENQGLNKAEKERRYGPYGEVGPRVVQLPGGVIPGAPATPPEPVAEQPQPEPAPEPAKPPARKRPAKKPAAKRTTRTRKPATPKAE